jgi:hypothetical protein
LVEDREAPDKMRVVDRRRFTEDGDLKPDWEASRPAPAEVAEDLPPAPTPAPIDEGERRPSSDGTAASLPLFLDLVNDLAQQAALFIEGAQGFPAQPAQAKRLIDYLGVLETKTRGNLSAEESQILSNIVFQLRTLFVQKRP